MQDNHLLEISKEIKNAGYENLAKKVLSVNSAKTNKERERKISEINFALKNIPEKKAQGWGENLKNLWPGRQDRVERRRQDQSAISGIKNNIALTVQKHLKDELIEQFDLIDKNISQITLIWEKYINYSENISQDFAARKRDIMFKFDGMNEDLAKEIEEVYLRDFNTLVNNVISRIDNVDEFDLTTIQQLAKVGGNWLKQMSDAEYEAIVQTPEVQEANENIEDSQEDQPRKQEEQAYPSLNQNPNLERQALKEKIVPWITNSNLTQPKFERFINQELMSIVSKYKNVILPNTDAETASNVIIRKLNENLGEVVSSVSEKPSPELKRMVLIQDIKNDRVNDIANDREMPILLGDDLYQEFIPKFRQFRVKITDPNDASGIVKNQVNKTIKERIKQGAYLSPDQILNAIYRIMEIYMSLEEDLNDRNETKSSNNNWKTIVS